jgi:hypothetical protein
VSFQVENNGYENICKRKKSIENMAIPYEISKVNFRVETKILVSM